MYAESKKDIYVTLDAPLLFGGKLSKILEDMGYQRNKYGWYVMNKIVKGKKMHHNLTYWLPKGVACWFQYCFYRYFWR